VPCHWRRLGRTARSMVVIVILSQGKLIDGLVEDLLAAIHKYNDTLYMATVIGTLEFVKQQLIQESMEREDDDD
jgi:hypothetical protein